MDIDIDPEMIRNDDLIFNSIAKGKLMQLG